jgi:hypothetical protein
MKIFVWLPVILFGVIAYYGVVDLVSYALTGSPFTSEALAISPH